MRRIQPTSDAVGETRPCYLREAALAVGQDVESRVDESEEELGAVSAPVKRHGDASFADEGSHLVEDAGEHFHETRVGLGGHDEERVACHVVDPVIRRRWHGKAHACDVRLREDPLTVIDSYVAVDVEEPHGLATQGDALDRESMSEGGSTSNRSEARELAADRLHLRGAIETQDPAEVIGGMLLEVLRALEPK